MGHRTGRPDRSRSAGFTVVELLIVLAMIAILTGLAFSYAGESRAGLRGFAGSLVGECDAARLRAISARRWQRAHLDAEAHKIVVEQATVTGMAEPADDEWTTVARLDVPRNVVVASIATTANVVAGESVPDEGDGLDEYLYFKPDGSSLARTVYVRSFDTGGEMRVVIYRATGTATAKEAW